MAHAAARVTSFGRIFRSARVTLFKRTFGSARVTLFNQIPLGTERGELHNVCHSNT